MDGCRPAPGFALAALARGLSGVGGGKPSMNASGEMHARAYDEGAGAPAPGRSGSASSARSMSHMSESSAAKSRSMGFDRSSCDGAAPTVPYWGLEAPEPE